MNNDKKFFNRFTAGFVAGVVTAAVLIFVISTIQPLQNMISGDKSAVSENAVDAEFKKNYEAIQGLLDKYYLDSDKIDKKTVQDGMYKGMLASIGDKYAQYYNEDEYVDLMQQNEGRYGGIGAYVSQDEKTGELLIINTFKDGPADKAGIKAGDVIIAVGETSVINMSLDEVTSLMKGKENTAVEITLKRGSETVNATVTREIVDVPTVSHRILDDTNIGYIYVSTFDDVTVEQFREAMDDIEAKGAASLIIDIRNNGGGMLTTVIDMLDRVLPEGLVMYTKTKDGDGEKYYSTDEESYDRPMVVLINGYSASASEVFAGAVQDFGAATLIGTKSYGKGVVQTLMTLNRSSGSGPAVKFTTSRYYTPKGRNIDGVGITPDIEIEYDAEDVEEKGDYVYDNQMRRAVEFLNGK